MTSTLQTRRLLASLIAVAAALFAASSAESTAPTAGEFIYRQGMLPSGELLVAQRDGEVRIEGAAAACVNCHRRSGLGMREGQRTIPPIAGSYLFQPRASAGAEPDLLFVDAMRADRDPYTDSTLVRAIRDGIAADGKPLSYLMPHYALDDEQMVALIEYLKRLSPGPSPGVTESVLHFATIVTPDADPVKRRGMLEVLEKFFADKNRYTRAQSPALHSSRRMMFKVNRRWELHVWQLTGPSASWQAQLREKLAAEPVFAVLSGMGAAEWTPIHRFCEEQALPCLFPNVDLPAFEQGGFDNLYLSQGVLLEARMIARELESLPVNSHPHRVLQLYRTNDVGKAAAEKLEATLVTQNVSVISRGVAASASGREVAAALRDVRPGDTLVLWLRPGDVSRLPVPPPGVLHVFLSGRMAGLERAPLAQDWRLITRMAYPFDLPERRRARLNYALGWFRIRQIPVVDEQMQTDTYLACGLVSEALNHMVDAFVRDYLVERVEGMLEHRAITGYYPRLSLAPGQRFASKGGYFVQFAQPAGTHIVAESDWIVP